MVIDNTDYLDRVRILPEKCNSGRFLAGKIYSLLKKERIEDSNTVKINNTGHITSPKHKVVTNLLELLPLRLDRDTVRIIQEFQPNVIYTTGASIRVFKYVYKTAQLTGKSVIVHYLDDYINNNTFAHCGVFSILNKVLLHYNDKCLKYADNIMCISEKMADEYRKKFNKNAYVAMNTSKSIVNHFHRRSIIPKLLYCGGMNINRDKVLEILCRAVDQINSSSIKILFDIYAAETTNFRNYWINHRHLGVSLYKLIPHDQMEKVIEEADICVYAENIDDESEKIL